jgi:dTDP-4-amino-4,6-dideoxygalactose transaminase
MLLVAEPSLGEEEKAALAEVIDCGWITMGDRVRAFERAFADRHGTTDAVAVSSCTAGLHLAMQALGLGPGDEVLVPALTFVATVNSVLYTGATPVFTDIVGLDLPLLSCADARAKCTKNTKAVIVMHYGGYLVDGDAWREFADAHGLILIEDAAHAVGVENAGRLGDAAVFSFFGNKNMTTAEGGMIVARNSEVLARIRQMRSHGMTSSTVQRMRAPGASYDVTMLGYNYRMDELRAAVGLVQIEKLSRWNEKRRALTGIYRDALNEYCPGVVVPFCQLRPSSHHIMPIVLPAGSLRQQVMTRMREAEIQTTVHYPPAHLFSLYRNGGFTVSLPRTEEFARRELTLPLHQKLEAEQVEAITVSLAKALAD